MLIVVAATILKFDVVMTKGIDYYFIKINIKVYVSDILE